MPRRARRPSLGIVGLVVGAQLVVSGFGVASAASLGGLTTARLTANTVAGTSGAPAVLAWENFNGTTGANIGGTTTDGGAKTWAVNVSGGVWQINANRARSTTADTSLVLNAGGWNATNVATVARNGATAFDAGFTTNRNAAGTQFLTCEWTSSSNGSMELWRYNSGWTLLTSVTNLYPGGIATAPASITFGCGTTATTLTATINGTAVASTTLSAGDQTTFKNSTHQLFGLYQYTSTGIRWDDFHLDSP